jgi:hypothetical protein
VFQTTPKPQITARRDDHVITHADRQIVREEKKPNWPKDGFWECAKGLKMPAWSCGRLVAVV